MVRLLYLTLIFALMGQIQSSRLYSGTPEVQEKLSQDLGEYHDSLVRDYWKLVTLQWTNLQMLCIHVKLLFPSERLVEEILGDPEARRLAEESKNKNHWELGHLFLNKIMFTGSCQEIGTCSSLSSYCSTNPSIAQMCQVTCELNGCSSANSIAPITL